MLLGSQNEPMNLWSKSVWIFTLVFLSFCVVFLYPSSGLILFVIFLLSVLIIIQALVILKDPEPYVDSPNRGNATLDPEP